MRFYILIGMTLLLLSCKKEFTIHATEQSTSGKAFLKIIHAAPSVTDSIDVYVGEEKVNGAKLGYSSIFPVSGVNSYLMVSPGTLAISAGGKTYSADFAAGKYYSYILTDAGQIFTEDDFPTPDTGTIAIRFINAANSNEVTLSSARHGAIATGGISAFTTVPYDGTIKDTLIANGVKLPLASIASFTTKRSYTVILKGSATLSLTGYVHY